MSILHKDGTLEVREARCHQADGIGDVSMRYPKYEPAFRIYGHVTDGFVGNAPAQLCDARGMKEVLELIHKRSNGAELMTDFEPLPTRLYTK